jgi:effector-binding domain-containing protein
MIKIGEFSKLVQVSVPTLRYYDQVGLLKPIEVDPVTGYRYYSASQLPRLHRILALKGLGFSLEQIGEALNDGLTPEQMRGMLRLRHAQITQQLIDTQNQMVEVEVRLQQIEREDQLSTYDVILKYVEPLLIASVRTILPSHDMVGTLFGEVYEGIGRHVNDALFPNPEKGGQSLVLWYDTEHKEKDVDGAAAFMLRCRVPEVGRMKVHELPAALMASTVHHGSYNTIGSAHEAVLKWIEANGYRIAGADRELNIFHTPPFRRDNPTYVTEIQYPVEKITHETTYSFSRSAYKETNMIDGPKIGERSEVHYVGIRTMAAHTELDKVIPQHHDEIYEWLKQQGIEPTGAPFIRYNCINMAEKLDVELGVPVGANVVGNERIVKGVLPSGRYASLTYFGDYGGLYDANAVLIGWAKEKGIKWDNWDTPQGDMFRSRVEVYIKDPGNEPDPAKYETEVAIKMADEQ